VKRKILSIAVTVGLLVGLIAAPAYAGDPPTLEEQIEASIDLGLAWLVPQQNADGSWGPGWDATAYTGFIVVKLEDRAYELGKDPFQEDPQAPDYYEYHPNVIAGLDYIFSRAGTYGLGTGICFELSGHETYCTGIAMMAIAASRTPARVVTAPNPVVNGMTYEQVLEACVKFFEISQNPDGGWRYWKDNRPSDNSNTGYATLGLRYAEEFGVAIPASIDAGLQNWVTVIQDPVDGDPDDGGSWYEVAWSWVNILKTGNLLFEMAFVGDTTATPRVQDAVDYIERHWDDPNPDPGWRQHRQAMYCVMKGFESLDIETITVKRGGADVEVDWFVEIATELLATQNADGSWPWDPWGDNILSTIWALLTLERIAPPPPPPSDIPVPIDIKPTSCPNPLNVKDRGVLPVAILGTEDLDVTQIDPATVELEHVAALRWALEDVAAPYPGDFSKPLDREDCWTEGPDGFMDLTVKFDAQEIVAAIEARLERPLADGEVLTLKLTGNLLEEFGGTAIVGRDVVWIKAKGK